MSDTKDLTQSSPLELEVSDVKAQIGKIQTLMKSVMKKDEHYGKIPGLGQKEVLLLPGAQKLGFTFRLIPEYETIFRDLGNNHREVETKCILRHQSTGALAGQGLGTCTTMESKYRYRDGSEVTDIEIPHAWWDKTKSQKEKAKLLPANHKVKKVDGEWVVVQVLGKVDNPDIADLWNTVLKISKKRAFVDAMLTATAASDIFTQDLEDFQEEKEEEPKKPVSDPNRVAKALSRAELFADTYKDSLSEKQTKSFLGIAKLAADQQDMKEDAYIYMAIGRAMAILIEQMQTTDEAANQPEQNISDTPARPPEEEAFALDGEPDDHADEPFEDDVPY